LLLQRIPDIRDASDRAVAILADQEGTVMSNGDADRAVPDLAIVDSRADNDAGPLLSSFMTAISAGARSRTGRSAPLPWSDG
jgi:hypothetical protein